LLLLIRTTKLREHVYGREWFLLFRFQRVSELNTLLFCFFEHLFLIFIFTFIIFFAIFN
jgi:hypothetical protein